VNAVPHNVTGGSYTDPVGGLTPPVGDPCTGAAYAQAPPARASIEHVMSYLG
jgi:hypothetical protein